MVLRMAQNFAITCPATSDPATQKSPSRLYGVEWGSPAGVSRIVFERSAAGTAAPTVLQVPAVTDCGMATVVAPAVAFCGKTRTLNTCGVPVGMKPVFPILQNCMVTLLGASTNPF